MTLGAASDYFRNVHIFYGKGTSKKLFVSHCIITKQLHFNNVNQKPMNF